MAGTTVYGTATDASVGLGNRPIIGKTGTTTGFKSAFFLGAIPQYAMAIGMFTPSPTYQVKKGVLASISQLGGGGVGGYWPAKIWNTFAQAEFANLSVDSFQNPVFTGSTWNMIGPLPKAPKKPAPKCTVKIHGQSFPIPGKGCPSATPTATPTNTQPGGFPTFPGQSPPATPTPSTSSTSTATATPTATATGLPTLPGGGHGGGNTAQTASGVKAGLAVGGLLAALLPGSLLWTTASRRRRKRGAGAKR
jgi:membrane peptidoglycan carboxypeptidase